MQRVVSCSNVSVAAVLHASGTSIRLEVSPEGQRDQRVVTPVEEGMLLRELHDEHGLSVREITTRLQRNASYVQWRIALGGTRP